MNMGMTMVPNPEMETVKNTSYITEQPLQQITDKKIQIYIDKVHSIYYLNYYAFLELALNFVASNGDVVYDLEGTTYKGDLSKQTVSIGSYDGLLAISPRTVVRLYDIFKDRIDYVDLGIKLNENKFFDFNMEMKPVNEMKEDSFDPSTNLKNGDLAALDSTFSNNNINEYSVDSQFKM